VEIRYRQRVAIESKSKHFKAAERFSEIVASGFRDTSGREKVSIHDESCRTAVTTVFGRLRCTGAIYLSIVKKHG
jgi:hypothetical protein